MRFKRLLFKFCTASCFVGSCPSASVNCSDTDECLNQTLMYSTNCMSCTNTVGSYTCQCAAGYQSLPYLSGCFDVDECASYASICAQSCVNTIGSYYCACNMDGYAIYTNQSLLPGLYQAGQLQVGSSCIPTMCPPISLAGTTYSIANNSVMASVSCPMGSGFLQAGSFVQMTMVSCGNSIWSQDVQCTLATCPSVSLTNGVVQYSNATMYGSVVNYSCNLGYTLVGPTNSSCAVTYSMNGTATYSWQGVNATCVPISCSAPLPAVNGNVTVNTFTVGSSAAYTCPSGSYFEQIGDTYVTVLYSQCLPNGQWNITASPVCYSMPVTCPFLPVHIPYNGQLYYLNGSYFSGDYFVPFIGTSVQYGCNQWNFGINGSSTLVCNGPPTGQLLQCLQCSGSSIYSCLQSASVISCAQPSPLCTTSLSLNNNGSTSVTMGCSASSTCLTSMNANPSTCLVAQNNVSSFPFF